MNRTITAAASFISIWIIGYFLVVGSGLLIPFIVAIFIWHLLNTISNAVQKTPYFGHWFPNGLSMVLALFILAILVKVVIDIIANNVTSVIAASPRYQENLLNIFNQLEVRYNIKVMTYFDSLIKDLSVQGVLVNIYGMFTAITSSAVIITLYVIFLYVEQHFFWQKIDALFPQTSHRQLVKNIINHIVKDTQTYLGIKTLMSLITATSSWVIMKWVGLDFAEFWALLIFFLNYIPNIGSILATLFPAILALIQFELWMPFVVVTLGIITVQFIVGNLIEPRFMGRSLNLSPLVILIALGLWGAVWGILGMFLAVPITVMMMIVFAHFEPTRPVAIMLSQNGHIKKAYEDM